MKVGDTRVSTEWLALREPADAAARSAELAGILGRRAPGAGGWVIHDLACGSGSMGRWLAPRLAGPQHWVLHDRDADLLEAAAADLPARAADGAPVTAEVRRSDITELRPDDLAGASLVTASALLDLLTGPELDGLVATLHGVGRPVLMTLSVTGHVAMTPPDPLDAAIAGAFNDHQRRTVAGDPLLGPDAPAVAAQAFRRLGAEVLVRPSPWRLGPGEAALTAEWLAGWVGAAGEQEPALAEPAGRYARARLAQSRAGRLAVEVHHADLLVLPPETAP